jgi:hypothetical protein
MKFSLAQIWKARPARLSTLVATVACIVALALVLKLLGASWENVAFAVAPALVLALLVPRLQALTRPRPRLTLTVEGAADRLLRNGALPPWPLDPERIVQNESADALATLRSGRRTPSRLTSGTMGMTAPPTEEDYRKTKERFLAEVASYEDELRLWLDEYQEAVIIRQGSFEVSISLANAVGAAHAEGVQVVLELPPTVRRAEPPSAIDRPPERPVYRPPAPRPLYPGIARGDSSVVAGFYAARPQIDTDALRHFMPDSGGWEEGGEGRTLTAPKAELQPGRRIEVAKTVTLRANAPGSHVVSWAIYSPDLDRPLLGSLELVVPAGDPKRQPFGRVEGIRRYPDVALMAGESEEEPECPPRNEDPPLRPPAVGDDESQLASLRTANDRLRWQALGLDQADDTRTSDEIQGDEDSQPDQKP